MLNIYYLPIEYFHMFINELNSRLKYTDFYNMPDINWHLRSFYATLDNNIVNDYNWLKTFKDKIHFDLLYDEKKVKLKYIERFIDKYYSRDWYFILLRQNITPEFINKYYLHINCTFDSIFDNKIIYGKILNFGYKLKLEARWHLMVKLKLKI